MECQAVEGAVLSHAGHAAAQAVRNFLVEGPTAVRVLLTSPIGFAGGMTRHVGCAKNNNIFKITNAYGVREGTHATAQRKRHACLPNTSVVTDAWIVPVGRHVMALQPRSVSHQNT